MDEQKAKLTRRAAIATVVGGATLAAATARSQLGGSTDVLALFEGGFSSPFFSLERGDHTAWLGEVGTELQTRGGPALRVTGVETFADYGRSEGVEELIRSRAFAVNFESVGSGRIAADTIYTVTHPRYGSFDLFLKTTPALPGFVQAVFN